MMTPEEQQQMAEDALAITARIEALRVCQASQAAHGVQAQLNNWEYDGPDFIEYPDGSKLYIDRATANCFASLT